MSLNRSAGILLPVFSLPSKHGIGTLGKAAFDFIDFLKSAGQTYWQMLPLGPGGSGDSPYSSYSVFAGNPYFIDLDLLVEEGILLPEEVDGIVWENDPDHVDYGIFHAEHEKLLKKAYAKITPEIRSKMQAFAAASGPWLENFALYVTLKKHFGGAIWTEWEDRAIRRHEADAVRKYREMLADEVDFHIFEQYLFYSQWDKVRAYAKEQGIGLIGDIPIYVALDSADVWSEPYFFQLDEENVPTFVAGVPPDYFSEDGQLWGNPLYDWERMERDGYGWWIRRIEHAAKLFDVLRIDHFRGLASYWAVPFGAKSAKEGKWMTGPGEKFVKVLTSWFYNLQFIAEDLGMLTPDVYDLLNATKLPGMKVLEFAFDPVTPSAYLPHYFPQNCVCYTGTHDNMTAAGWVLDGAAKEVEHARKYLGLDDLAPILTEEAAETVPEENAAPAEEAVMAEKDAIAEAAATEKDSDAEAAENDSAADDKENSAAVTAVKRRELSPEEIRRFDRALIRAGMSSIAVLFVAQMQDYLCLDNSARTNVPGVAEGNWSWKMRGGAIPEGLAEEIAAMTKLYGR